jgi:heme a synthase
MVEIEIAGTRRKVVIANLRPKKFDTTHGKETFNKKRSRKTSSCEMTPPPPSRWLHLFAWFVATLTLLLPVATGAVVTTLEAGMAFADWPSSDGYNMLAYPWLSAARDQFIEHGHRLSGLMIGVWSILLAVFAWMAETRSQVKLLATAIFASVFVQGMLGGARVLLDKDLMALIHGDFAAGVFSLMAVLVLITGSRWESRRRIQSHRMSRAVIIWTVSIALLIGIQYFLGGVLRHLKNEFGWAWSVHPWFALAPLLSSIAFAFVARRFGSEILIRWSLVLAIAVISQALLGLLTWYFKHGVPAWGVVAEQNSISQIVVCSLHKIVGMLTLMTAVLTAFNAWSIRATSEKRSVINSADNQPTLLGVAT